MACLDQGEVKRSGLTCRFSFTIIPVTEQGEGLWSGMAGDPLFCAFPGLSWQILAPLLILVAESSNRASVRQ